MNSGSCSKMTVSGKPPACFQVSLQPSLVTRSVRAPPRKERVTSPKVVCVGGYLQASLRKQLPLDAASSREHNITSIADKFYLLTPFVLINGVIQVCGLNPKVWLFK